MSTQKRQASEESEESSGSKRDKSGTLEVQRKHLASHARRPKPAGLSELDTPGMFVGGGVLALLGIKNIRSIRGALMTAAGGGLIFQALRKNNFFEGGFVHNLKQTLLNTGASQGLQVRATITIDRPVQEVYAHWRDLSTLSTCMRHIESIERIDETLWRWKAHIPKTDSSIEWDAEITEERENEMITWRSVESAEIQNEGMVEFQPHPNGTSTEMHAHIVYYPPAGAVGRAIGSFMRGLNERVIREDLRRFKRHIETGEIPTTEGQTSGRLPFDPSTSTATYSQQKRR
ncbi:MAG: SRPBCC family protein [Persicimonas sp.]